MASALTARKPRVVVCASGCISHTWPSHSRVWELLDSDVWSFLHHIPFKNDAKSCVNVVNNNNNNNTQLVTHHKSIMITMINRRRENGKPPCGEHPSAKRRAAKTLIGESPSRRNAMSANCPAPRDINLLNCLIVQWFKTFIVLSIAFKLLTVSYLYWLLPPCLKFWASFI